MRIRSALVRPVSARYAECLRSADEPIDVGRARRQHDAYVAALRAAGVAVTAIAPLDEAPDAVFVEDPVVVLPEGVVLTRPGAPSRRTEGDSIRPHLPGPLHVMGAPAWPVTASQAHLRPFARLRLAARRFAPCLPCLDGGDVLRVGTKLYVGLSARTNRAGLEALAGLTQLEVVPVEVQAGLHLKSAVTRLGDRVIGRFDRIDRALFPDPLDAPEEMGANVLDLGDTVLVSAAAPRTAELVASLGRSVVTVDVSELHKGDGALTCLSIRFGELPEA